jgi:hypothetical protein
MAFIDKMLRYSHGIYTTAFDDSNLAVYSRGDEMKPNSVCEHQTW